MLGIEGDVKMVWFLLELEQNCRNVAADPATVGRLGGQHLRDRMPGHGIGDPNEEFS